jgi:ACS family hexuronate transporter-like MFS transporter
MNALPITLARNMRWVVCAMLLLATLISYINRQTVAIVAPILAKEFQLNNEQIGRILSSFLLAYTFGQFAAGRLFDRIGSRLRALDRCVVSRDGAHGRRQLSYRTRQPSLASGRGRVGQFSSRSESVSEWFPPHERSFAGGVFAKDVGRAPGTTTPISRQPPLPLPGPSVPRRP